MPLLDIITPQSSFRNNNLYSIGFQRIHHASFLSGNPKPARWRHFPNSSGIQMNRGRLIVRAFATLEPVSTDKENDNAPPPAVANSPATGEKPPIQDEKELLRRKRISKANKGKEAWNKGVKHSPETIQKIRERTRLAMRSPQVKMKLLNGIHNQTRETRLKIAAAVKLTWDRKRFTRRMIARCHREWLDLIAEASRKGLSGEEELQWDSYEIINQQLGKEFREGIESRKKKRGPGPGGRAPKTLEQRRKISEAIAAKWADPVYRDRVYSGIAKQRGKNLSKPRDPYWGTKKMEAKRVRPVKKRDELYNNLKIRSQPIKVKPVKVPQARFKDPQARYKLEMIKSIRAQRAASDPKISEAILRANILIGEAQRAAEALEAAAATSPVAEASLIETRKLIAEAMSYIKSIETGNTGSLGTGFDKEEIVEGVKEIEQGGRVNGTRSVEISKLGDVGLQANVNGTVHADLSPPPPSSSSMASLTSSLPSSSSLSSWSDLSLKRKEVEEDGKKKEKGGIGRRWVCGRLIEVEDEAEDQ